MWSVSIDGKTYGPYSMEELHGFAGEGRIRPETFVWRQGMDGWKAAGEVPELSALFVRLGNSFGNTRQSTVPHGHVQAAVQKRRGGWKKWVLIPLFSILGLFATFVIYALISSDKPVNKVMDKPGLDASILAKQSAGEVSVSLPEWVLPEGGKVEVEKDENPPVTAADAGVTFVAYDVHLPEGGNMQGVAEISIPFDKKLLPKDADPEDAVGAAYYDPVKKQWIPMPCLVDSKKGSVTIFTDHFSKFAAVILKDGRKKLSEAMPKYSDTPIQFYSQTDLEKIVAEGTAKTAESTTAVEKGWNKFNEMYNLTGAGSTVLEATVGTETLKNVNKLMNEAGLGFAFAQLAFDLYKDDRNAAVRNFAKNGAFYSVSKWGADALGLASAGVVFIDVAVNKFGETALEKNLAKWEGAYRRYYETKELKRSAEDWYNIIVKLNTNRESKNSDELKNRLEDELNSYCNKFWKDDFMYEHVADSTPGIIGFGAGGEAAAGKDEISARYKDFVFTNTVRPALAVYARKVWFSNMMKAEEDLNKLKAEMNKVYTVTVQLENHTSVKDLKTSTVRFINQKGTVVHSQTFDSNGQAVLKMSLFGFVKNGGPVKLEVSVPAQGKTPALKTQITYKLEETDTVVNIPYSPEKEEVKPEEKKQTVTGNQPAKTEEVKNTGFMGSWKFKFTITDTVLPDSDKDEMMDELADQFTIATDENGKPCFTVIMSGSQMTASGSSIKWGFKSHRYLKSADVGYEYSNRWFFEGTIDKEGKTMNGEFQAINKDNAYFIKGKWEAQKVK